MTLDQVFMLLTDRRILRGFERTMRASADEVVASVAGETGSIRGRAQDGTPITGRVCGKSLARQLMEMTPRQRRAWERERRARERARRAEQRKG